VPVLRGASRWNRVVRFQSPREAPDDPPPPRCSREAGARRLRGRVPESVSLHRKLIQRHRRGDVHHDRRRVVNQGTESGHVVTRHFESSTIRQVTNAEENRALCKPGHRSTDQFDQPPIVAILTRISRGLPTLLVWTDSSERRTISRSSGARGQGRTCRPPTPAFDRRGPRPGRWPQEVAQPVEDDDDLRERVQ